MLIGLIFVYIRNPNAIKQIKHLINKLKFYRFNIKPSNLGKSSSSNSVTVSRNRLVTPNVHNYSGDQGSSHTKSSTTPQASTSFKVVGKNNGIFSI